MSRDEGGKTKLINRKFWFIKSHQEIIDEINKKYPITLKYNQDLIDRIYDRYPVMSKAEIALIVKSFFIIWRELLVSDKALFFQNLFGLNKLLFYTQQKLVRLKCQIITHKSLKDL